MLDLLFGFIEFVIEFLLHKKMSEKDNKLVPIKENSGRKEKHINKNKK